jgi:putative DNA primase/helicase
MKFGEPPPHARFDPDEPLPPEPWTDPSSECSGAVQVPRLPTTSLPLPSGIIRMADVQSKAVEWLWEGRLPAGMPSVLDGESGCGKTTVALDITARLTTGRPLPGESVPRRPVDVMLVGYEDSPQHTIRPRLDAAGADVARVHLLQEVGGRCPRLPGDADEIERHIRATGARLLVFDPITAYIDADLHRDNEVRAALAPLAAIAERTGASILALRHLRKSGGTSAINRGLGSVAITAVARATLMLLQDPDDAAARILAWPKMNVARVPTSLRWRSVRTASCETEVRSGRAPCRPQSNGF